MTILVLTTDLKFLILYLLPDVNRLNFVLVLPCLRLSADYAAGTGWEESVVMSAPLAIHQQRRAQY